jgi:Predicted ATP-dependent serine protease
MNTAGSVMKDTVKEFKSLSSKQILALVAALIIAIALTLLGFAAGSCMCFGMLIIAITLYMLPHMMGVESIKIKVVLGAVFFVVTLLIGGLFTAPALVNDFNGAPQDNDHFSNVEYIYDNNDLKISADVTDIGTNKVVLLYGEVEWVDFSTWGTGSGIFVTLDLDPTETRATGTVPLDPNKLFVGKLGLAKLDDTGKEVFISETGTDATCFTNAFDGSITMLALKGCFITLVSIIAMFLLILLLSNVMRKRMEATRQKMESEGRLYPQGYGRCDRCNSVVLPNEVQCRKCGAYIDRPKDMKPNKKDFFECSECGAEVPNDAKECPKCGVPFDEEEIEVVHADGTVEVTNETFECSECGAVVPVTATFCPKCGAKFED